MSEAVKVAGSTAKQAGLEYEQLSAIVAKTMEKTRLEGSQIGNGLKTIFTRISKASTMSDEVDNETISKAAKALHDIGVEVYTVDGEFREFDVIMGELAGKWDLLTDAQQANISFELAATRQTNLLKSVLANYSDSMELAAEATETQGNALDNQEKYVDSYKGKLQGLSTAAETTWIHALDSDATKGFIDLATKLVNILDTLIDKFGVLGTLAIGSGAIGGIKNIGKHVQVYGFKSLYCFEYALYAQE